MIYHVNTDGQTLHDTMIEYAKNIVLHKDLKSNATSWVRLFSPNTFDGAGCEILTHLYFGDISISSIDRCVDEDIDDIVKKRFNEDIKTATKNQKYYIIIGFKCKNDIIQMIRDHGFALIVVDPTDSINTMHFMEKGIEYPRSINHWMVGCSSTKNLNATLTFFTNPNRNIIDDFIMRVDQWVTTEHHRDQQIYENSLGLYLLFLDYGIDEFVSSITSNILLGNRILLDTDKKRSDELIDRARRYCDQRISTGSVIYTRWGKGFVVFAENHRETIAYSVLKHQSETDFVMVINLGEEEIFFYSYREGFNVGNTIAKFFGGHGTETSGIAHINKCEISMIRSFIMQYPEFLRIKP